MKSKLTQLKFTDLENLGEQGQKLMNFLVSDCKMNEEDAYETSVDILRSDQPKQDLRGLLNYLNPYRALLEVTAEELAIEILGDIN